MNEIHDIHQPFLSWLHKNNLLYVYHRPDKRSGIASGWPDFTICHCGRCLLIEAKTLKGKVTPIQHMMHVHLKMNGNTVVIARNASEAIVAVQTWLGVERSEIQPPERENGVSRRSRDIYLGHVREMLANAGRPGMPQGPCQCEICKKVRPTVGVTFFPEDCPLDNERAVELIEAETNHAYWIASLAGIDYVFAGNPAPGGLAKLIRRASPQDIRDLPRK